MMMPMMPTSVGFLAQRSDPGGCAAARLGLDGDHIIEGRLPVRRVVGKLSSAIEHVGDDVDDLREADAPVQKRRRCLLVRRVVHRRVALARLRDVAREANGRERGVVEGQERPLHRVGEVEGRLRPRDALRPCQRVGDRQLHRRRRGLGDCRPVGEGDHGVDNGLRVHGDVDKRRRDVEQQGGLNELETLVHQRRGVQRVHLPHRPRRVRRRLLRRDVPHLLAGAAAKRPARGGEHEARDLATVPGAQALGHGRVLGVHGHDLSGLCAAGDDSPPATSDSLFASANRAPVSSTASVAASPCEPTSALSTVSAGCERTSSSASATTSPPKAAETSRAASGFATATCDGVSPSSRACLTTASGTLPPAAMPTTRNLSGLSAITSRACVPMEPVEPKMTTCFIEPIMRHCGKQRTF